MKNTSTAPGIVSSVDAPNHDVIRSIFSSASSALLRSSSPALARLYDQYVPLAIVAICRPCFSASARASSQNACVTPRSSSPSSAIAGSTHSYPSRFAFLKNSSSEGEPG
jgi:hypothetical protein